MNIQRGVGFLVSPRPALFNIHTQPPTNMTDLRLCNLVSRGMSMADARKRLGLDVAPVKPEAVGVAEPEVQPSEPVEVQPSVEDDELETLRQQLAELGIHASPRAKIETLRKKLDEALAGDEE